MEIRESITREILINDIEVFLVESLKLYNTEKIVKRTEFLNLESRICDLNNYNFESEIKYKNFLKYINQPELQAKIYLAVTEYTKNPIGEGYFNEEDPHFHRILNYLNTLKDWLQ